MNDVISNYLENIHRLLLTINIESVSLIKDELLQAGRERNTIYLIGNGISSATSEHFANDLAKKASEHLVKHFGYRFNVITLTQPIPFITAIANDLSLEEIFVESLKLNSKRNDLLLILSSSKPHENIRKAVQYAKEKGLKIIAITGMESGVLAQLADICYCVLSDQTDLVETIFMFLSHYLAVALNEELKPPVKIQEPMIV